MDIKKILFKTNTIDVEKALPDAIVFCNKDGKIQWVNDKAAEIFETSKMHLLTSNISDFIENALDLATVAFISSSAVITRFLLKEYYFDMTAQEIEEGYVLSFRDIKNQAEAKACKEEEDEYKAINRDKNIFLLKLANDFKSPLQSIVGFSQAMADGLGGQMSEQQDKYIRIIKKNSSELMYFISKLLELSQSEAEVKKPEYKTFDFFYSINSIVKFNEQLYKDKDVRWVTTFEEGLRNTIVSDETIVKNIIQNILDVILKSVDMGEISVSLSLPNEEILQAKSITKADYVMLSISSSSLLLSENDLDCMFDPYKVIDTSNRKNLLRAITLATAKNLVKALGGYIWVESTILKNTSFNVVIPSNII